MKTFINSPAKPPLCTKWRRFRVIRRQTKSQATVEFAIICLPFFVLLFAIFDYAQIYFYWNSLQNGVREATRFATTGQVIQRKTPPLTKYNAQGFLIPVAVNDKEGAEASRNCCIHYWFQSNCVLQLPTNSVWIYSATAGKDDYQALTAKDENGEIVLRTRLTADTSTNASYGPGVANDFIQIKAKFTIHTITPFFSYLGGYGRSESGKATDYQILISTIAKNEPATVNFEHRAYYDKDDTNGNTTYVY